MQCILCEHVGFNGECTWFNNNEQRPCERKKETMVDQKVSRESFLDEAKKNICGQREQDYGSPEDNFARIAKLWTAYLNKDITPMDVSMMMSLMKIARIMNGGTRDSFVDLAGYAACGGEIFERSKKA